MEFFPEVNLSHGAAEAIARGLFAIARVDGVHEREAGLIASFWIDAGGGGPLSDLERAEAIKPADLAAALHSDAERQLFIKTAILLTWADGAVSAAEKKAVEPVHRARTTHSHKGIPPTCLAPRQAAEQRPIHPI